MKLLGCPQDGERLLSRTVFPCMRAAGRRHQMLIAQRSNKSPYSSSWLVTNKLRSSITEDSHNAKEIAISSIRGAIIYVEGPDTSLRLFLAPLRRNDYSTILRTSISFSHLTWRGPMRISLIEISAIRPSSFAKGCPSFSKNTITRSPTGELNISFNENTTL